MFKLSSLSKKKLQGVKQPLVDVVNRALELSEIDFGISEGVRSLERQKQLYSDGKSKTMNSRHLTGDAVDVYAWVDGNVSWMFHYYEDIAKAMFKAAEELGIEIEWGGNWKTFRDGPHFQLKRNKE